jgi:uncharacterized protein (TIGR03435 family)
MIAALSNHLWQSTLFVLAAALVVAALRQNGAHVRHAVWLVASLKFLVPFALLMSLGSALPGSTEMASRAAPAAIDAPALSETVDWIAQPFADDLFVASSPATPAASRTNWTVVVLAGLWACGLIAVVIMRLRGWRQIRAALRTSTPASLASPVPVRSAPGLLEPGVVGIFRPVLLLPAGIEGHLTPPQLEAVLAHELCHVQRRDNLTSAIHMVVEAIFWFHPLVWWVGARLIDERERACDEHVLRVCREPQVYAESILNVCKLYVESPLACVSGVSGADLKRRVAAIMVNNIVLRLNFARKVALTMAGILAIGLPLIAGMLTAPLRASAFAPGQARSSAGTSAARFEVVSIKPCEGNSPTIDRGTPPPPGGRSGVAPWSAQASPGSVYWHCATLAQLIAQGYADQDHPLLNVHTQLRIEDSFQPKHVRGGPSWVTTDKFTIEARSSVDLTNPVLAGRPTRTLADLPAAISHALRATLEDRFQLTVRRAVEQRAMYVLGIAKNGLNKERMKATTPGDCVTSDEYLATDPSSRGNLRICGRYFVTRSGTWEFRGGTLKELAKALSSTMDSFVLDQSGVETRFTYDLDLALVPRDAQGDDRFIQALAPLGLKIEQTKGPAEYLNIDSVQKLRPNGPDADAPPARAVGPGAGEPRK